MRDTDVRRTRRLGRIGLLGLVAALTGALLPVGSASAVDAKPEWGSVSAHNGVLKASCREYAYTYRVTAPERGDWDLNVTVVGPGRRVLWFDYLYEGANPAEGTSTFRICRSKTRPGRFRLKAIVSVQDGDDNIAGRLDTAVFRLRKAR